MLQGFEFIINYNHIFQIWQVFARMAKKITLVGKIISEFLFKWGIFFERREKKW